MKLFCRKGDRIRLTAPLISGWRGIGFAAEDVPLPSDDDFDPPVPFYKADDPDHDPDQPPCLATVRDVEVLSPTDEELFTLIPETMRDEFSYAAEVCSKTTGVNERVFLSALYSAALEYGRAVVARWER